MMRFNFLAMLYVFLLVGKASADAIVVNPPDETSAEPVGMIYLSPIGYLTGHFNLAGEVFVAPRVSLGLKINHVVHGERVESFGDWEGHGQSSAGYTSFSQGDDIGLLGSYWFHFPWGDPDRAAFSVRGRAQLSYSTVVSDYVSYADSQEPTTASYQSLYKEDRHLGPNLELMGFMHMRLFRRFTLEGGAGLTWERHRLTVGERIWDVGYRSSLLVEGNLGISF